MAAGIECMGNAVYCVSGVNWADLVFLATPQKDAYRREAIANLSDLAQRDDTQFLSQLNALLKQVAISTYGRAACGGLNNQAWLAFLKSKAAFIEHPNSLQKLEQRYQAQPTPLTAQERESLIYFAQRWIRGHHL